MQAYPIWHRLSYLSRKIVMYTTSYYGLVQVDITFDLKLITYLGYGLNPVYSFFKGVRFGHLCHISSILLNIEHFRVYAILQRVIL